MKGFTCCWILWGVLVLLAGCGGGASGTEPTITPATTPTATDTAGAAAYGDVPAGLPPRLTVGLIEEPGDSWMRDSGVAWDLRYHYFTLGWRDNWGWDTGNSGSWGRNWMDECADQGFVPVVEYYELNGVDDGDESQLYATTRDTTAMAAYFDDFKVLLQRAKEFDRPVLVLLEADGFGFLEQQTGDDPDAYAAVAATGLPELAGLPDTVAGWGLAFLQLRNAVGADKVILGIHVSAWASGKDIAYAQADAPLPSEVDKVYNFLAPLGLAANVTGSTYDLLVTDPLDRDADYYRLTLGQDRWWNASDDAALTTQSFNHYAEWLHLWNQKAGKRWVLWQIPLGNSNHLNVANTNGAREGYRDNRAEYFFGNGTNHLRKFADAGVIALLFGPGQGDQAFYTNDVYTDGQLFMQSRAGAILNAGGVPIVTAGQ